VETDLLSHPLDQGTTNPRLLAASFLSLDLMSENAPLPLDGLGKSSVVQASPTAVLVQIIVVAPVVI